MVAPSSGLSSHSPYVRPPLVGTTAMGLALLVVLTGAFVLYLATARYQLTRSQVLEFTIYGLVGGLAIPALTLYFLCTRRSRREKREKHPPLAASRRRDAQALQNAWQQNAVVLGYNIHGEPWLWPDKTRVMQGIVVGQTGSGKTTLLRNIITQDLERRIGPPEERRKIPMVIFDGKGDLEFFYDLLPHIQRAGRLDDLRLLNPARPELSCLYNPFHTDDDNYMAQVNMVFGSFNLHDEFFAKHQLNYLADIVRVLHYTGLVFNFYDVLVTAMDVDVLNEQVEKARRRIERDPEISLQRRLNFEMSVRNLMQSLEDRERVQKIQGLLNECMTFLDDELSVMTGAYDHLLSIDDVIEQELILFVTLNVNKNTEPVRALGKMLLQNLQLVVGKRYESETERKRKNKPLFSVVLDEFAPFGYQNFGQILNTARGTNTAFLFSMQSLPQLLRVGRGFKEDVTSAPNTTIALRTRDEETARFFIRASAERPVKKRSFTLWREQIFSYERFERGNTATEREEMEYRVQEREVKNLGKGQMQVLMTDDTEGTLHTHLHVRAPLDVRVPGVEWELLPRLRHSREDSRGANLRFKDPQLESRNARRLPGGRRI
ncbi:MAG: type IV secretory system conjugative DNA transfer family protein [Bryobacterales bacterium]|nr:type IV secretory system conjugative DNA transfer family protein [Bryobacterales bacterium]